MADGAHLSTIKSEPGLTAQEIGQACVQYRPMLYGLALRYTRGDRDAADELVQETIVTAMQVHANFDPERGAIATWLRWQFRSAAQKLRLKRARRESIEGVSLTHETEDGPMAERDIAVDPTQDLAADLADAGAAD